MNRRYSGSCLALAVSVAVVAGCGSVVAAPSSSPVASSRRVLLRGLDMPQAYAAGGQLYVIQRVIPPVNQSWGELMRVDPASGHIYAVRKLYSTFDQALLADGALWVTTSSATPRPHGSWDGKAWLWQFDPRTLSIRFRRLLPGPNPDGRVATMAVAGGWLWVGNVDALDRVSLSTGKLTARINVPNGQLLNVASSPSGRTLLVSEGGDEAHVQRRNPYTGALIASSQTFEGVTSPYIGGVIDREAWISQSGGMMGYVVRLNVATLKTTPFAGAMRQPWVGGPADIWGTNGIRAQLIDGILWVSQLAGGPGRNYCGDPRTGISRAPIELPHWGMFLTADATNVYYVRDVNTRREELDREPINPRCRIVPDAR